MAAVMLAGVNCFSLISGTSVATTMALSFRCLFGFLFGQTGVALGEELPEKLPYNEYYEYFGPEYSLYVAASNMENRNTNKQLEEIKCNILDNLSKLQHAPSVQFEERIPETKLPEVSLQAS